MSVLVDPLFEIERASDGHFLDIDQAKTYFEAVSNSLKGHRLDYSESFDQAAPIDRPYLIEQNYGSLRETTLSGRNEYLSRTKD